MSKKTISPDDQEAKAYNWVLLTMLLLVIFLVAQTPARIIANFLPNTTRAMFQAWGGTIWAGQVNAQYKDTLGQVRWHLDPLALFTLKLGLNIELITHASQIDGRILWGHKGWQLKNSKGQVAPNEIQSLLSGWQLPNNPLIIQNLNLNYVQQSWQGSQGLVTWQAGGLDYVLDGQRQHINLPQVSMTIKSEQKNLELILKDVQQDANLAMFTIKNASLESRLTQRFLSYSPNYRGVAEADAVVVTSSQPLSDL